MKTSSLILAFCLAVGMAVQSDAKKDETIQAKDSGNQDQLTTFTEYDEMTFEEQNKFIADRGVIIYAWLKENDPAKAQCMHEKFIVGRKTGVGREAMIELEKQIKGVSEENRPKYHVEALMANYIVYDLCSDAKVPTAAQNPKPALK